MSIHAVIFDIGGVFARTEDVSGRHKWEQRLGLAEDTLAMTVWSSDVSCRGEIGQATLEEIWQGIGQLFALDAAEVKELQADFWSGGTWDDDLTEFVRSLKPRYKTGVISNAWPCGARGGDAASRWRCCITPSAKSIGAANARAGWASMPRATPARSDCMRGPACLCFRRR